MNIKGKKILVIGGMGFLGKYVSRELIARGAEVESHRRRYGDLRNPTEAWDVIGELTDMLTMVMEYRGMVFWDETKPDGQPRRCLNVQAAVDAIGWSVRVSLEDGLRRTTQWFRQQNELRNAA